MFSLVKALGHGSMSLPSRPLSFRGIRIVLAIKQLPQVAVRGSIVVNAAVLKGSSVNIIAVSLFAKDRPGMLLALTERILALDPRLSIECADGKIHQSIAFVSLLVSLRTNVPYFQSMLEHLAREISGPLDCESINPTGNTIEWVVRGVDSPGLLARICKNLYEKGINIRQLSTESHMNAKKQSICRLTFKLTCPESMPNEDLPSLTEALHSIDPEAKSVFLPD